MLSWPNPPPPLFKDCNQMFRGIFKANNEDRDVDKWLLTTKKKDTTRKRLLALLNLLFRKT